MSRPIQPGDFVHVSLGDSSEYYKIRNISADGIHISPINDPNAFSKLNFNGQRWTVFGTTQNFQLNFLTKEQYQEQIQLESLLLSLPNEIIFEIGLTMPLSDLTRLCQTHGRLDAILCNNRQYWAARYIQDFGRPETKIENWKQAYMNKLSKDIYVFGDNSNGQLGLGDKNNRLVPTKLEGYKAKIVAGGGYHTIFIDQQNDIYVFGFNGFGQLGLDDTNIRL